MKFNHLWLLVAVIVGLSWTPIVYGQLGQNVTSVNACTSGSTQHWDKIIFEITDKKLAQKAQQPKDTELDIKVLDNPNEVTDLKKKILDFLGLPLGNENRNGLTILDVSYAVLCTEKNIVLSPKGDDDGDGLLNKWEQNGMDQNNDNKIDLILPDANPLHKDIYVEVDYMTAHKPWVQAISDVISSFERAPVTNPDGYNGINLHVDVDEQISHQPTTDMASLITIRNSNFGTMGQRADPNSVNVIGAKLMAYHYALFGHSQPGTSSSGRSNGIPSMEFLVSLGAPGWGIDPLTGHNVGSTDQQEGTFMHELGHNLNLHHGGSDDINCKPNYLSIMSYSRQFSSLIGDRPLDYSRSVLSSLPENNLDENLGISVSTPLGLRTIYGPLPGVITTAGSPDDWSGDVDTIDIGVARDLNNVDSCPVSPGEVLNGYDDWNGLIYVTTPAAGLSTETTMTNETLSPEGNATVSSSPENNPALDELTANDVRQHRNQLLEGINDTINSLPSTAFIQPTEAEAIKADLTTEPQSRLANISTLLQTDKLDAAIADLNLLKNQTDSSIGGLARDDEITSLPAQQKVLPLIDNLIQVLEKQK